MNIHFVYLIAILPLAIIWVIFFLLRKDLRKEIVIMSIILGIASSITCYFWWTKDWWTPITITGGNVGVEDFLGGFFSGGVMVSLYEIIFRKKLKPIKKYDSHAGVLLLLTLAFITAVLFWGIGLSSFWASTIGFIICYGILFYNRKDLFICGIYSGVLMLITVLVFYITAVLVSPEWVAHTYSFPLSGVRIINIPLEEFIFWFLAGVLWGPFYEYWQGKKLINK